jgi:putative ABC transport system ATP-binding protein
MMIISRDLCCQHVQPPAAVLSFPDVDVAPGGVLLLSGGTGCGKSTWLALAAGLLSATSGSLQVAGEPLGQLSQAARDAWRLRAVGVLPQTAPVNPLLTVRANLALPFLAAGWCEDTWAISHALSALNIASLAKKKVSELSSPQVRRVALARALLLEPGLLLLDEPVAGLREEDARGMLEALRAWVTEKASTLVVALRDARIVREVFAQASTVELLAPRLAMPC